MTDTPNVNPLNTDQPVQRRPTPHKMEVCKGPLPIRLLSNLLKQSASGPENARVVHYEGNVDIRIGTYRLQADKVDCLRSREPRRSRRQRRFRSGRPAANHGLARRVELSHQNRLLRRLDRFHKPNAGRHAYLLHCRSRREESASTRSSPRTCRSQLVMKTFRSGVFTRAGRGSRQAIACVSIRRN